MSSLELFQWFYATPIAETIRNSTWLFPVIEAFHLLGLGLTVGSVLLVELRLLVFLALLFTFTIRRRLTRTDLTAERPRLGRAMAIVSLSLWFGVAWGGRWIGFS